MELEDQIGPVNLHVLAGSPGVSPRDLQNDYYYEVEENPMSLTESIKTVIQYTVKRPRSLLSKSRDLSPLPLKLVASQDLLTVPNGIHDEDSLDGSYGEIVSQYQQSFYKFHGRYPERRPSTSPTSSDWSESLGPPEPIEFNEATAASGNH